jgi:hypothetical protein
MREPALGERVHGSPELRRRQATARRLFGGPMQVERHSDDLPLNRRLVAATTERIRSALADLVGQRARGVERRTGRNGRVTHAEHHHG